MQRYKCLFTASLLLLSNAVFAGKTYNFQPEQVHISYGDNVYEIVVTWSTFDGTPNSIVEYGANEMNLTAEGVSHLFVDGGAAKHSQYIHRVKLANLIPNTRYRYHCGSDLGWSDTFSFKTPPPEGKWQPSLAIFGDMGNENAQSLTRLQEEAQRDMYDAILHVGDFAYDMDSQDAAVGDAFMRQIEPIAAYIPYMTCPGNHEEKYNFSNYKNRFSMPGTDDAYMFSINIGPLHLVSISTEVYYFVNFGIKPLVLQYDWLVNDLRNANEPHNRAKQPWIVIMGHKPMYCSNNNKADCTHNQTFTRVGIPFFHMFGLEKVLYDNGVDLGLWAHQHSYERLWPVYDYQIHNGSHALPYVNPGAPVHIVTGSAGCDEEHATFNDTQPYWSAFRATDYGYTRLKAYNATHLYIEQISDEKSEVIDSIWIVKDSHLS